MKKKMKSLFELENVALTDEFLSRRNDVRIARIRQLQQRQFRDRSRVFLCEGPRFIYQAYGAGTHIQQVLHAPELAPVQYDRLLAQLRKRGVPVLRVSKEVFLGLTLAEEPSGLMAVCGQQVRRLNKIDPMRHTLMLALDGVRSPGNLGTTMRTCEAAGVSGLILVDNETDFYHPAVVRASMGAIFTLSLVRSTRSQLFAWASQHGCSIVGTSPQAVDDYRAISYRAPSVVLMGSERKGLNDALLSACDHVVKIPMHGSVDSLNMAVATGIVLYEARNQLLAARSCLP